MLGVMMNKCTKCGKCGKFQYDICQECQNDMAIYELIELGIEILVLN